MRFKFLLINRFKNILIVKKEKMEKKNVNDYQSSNHSQDRTYIYLQRDPKWGDQKMIKDKLGDQGCFITSLANCFYVDDKQIIRPDCKEDCNPLNLLQFIKEKSFIDNEDLIDPKKICESFDYEYKEIRFTKGSQSYKALEHIKKYISEGGQIIIQINYYSSHFMNVLNLDGYCVVCFDPLDNLTDQDEKDLQSNFVQGSLEYGKATEISF